MMWMNSYEISEALVRFENHPVLSKAARLLDMLREETDNHSDGWHSWPRPARAAERLMVLLKSGRGTEQDLKLAVRPIKAFLTRYGNKFGLDVRAILGTLENKPAPAKTDVSFDLHVWIQPEDENMHALFTISEQPTGTFCQLDIDGAVAWFRDLLEEKASFTGD